MQRTLVIFKPDAVQRALTGELLARFEKRGFLVIALKLMRADRALAETHYEVHKGKSFYEDLVNYITSAPVVVMILQGHEAVSVVRSMVGATRPWESPPGTIRGDYALMGLRNLIHASDAVETADKEIALWFRPDEIHPYARELDKWISE